MITTEQLIEARKLAYLAMSVFRWMLAVRHRVKGDFFARTEDMRKAFSHMSDQKIEALVYEAIAAVRNSRCGT